MERNDEGHLQRVYDGDIAQTVRDCGNHVMANLSTTTNRFERLRAQAQRTPAEDDLLRHFDDKIDTFRRLAELGIPMVCGTDSGVLEAPFDETWREVAYLVRSGLSHAEAIRAATSRAAKALRLEGKTGRIAPGLSADLVAIANNPLADETAFAKPRLVVLRGRTVLDRIAA